jgi:hypothetical protein
MIIVNIPTAKPAIARPVYNQSCFRIKIEEVDLTCEHHGDVDGTSLNCGTDGEDGNGNNDGPFATEAVRQWAVDERTKPSSEQ